MAVYVMMTTLTDEGRKTIKNNPERILEVNKEVEEMGGKIIAQYAVLGPYDFINIIETVGNTTITKIALELSSRGTLQSMTLAAIPIDDLIASWNRPGVTEIRSCSWQPITGGKFGNTAVSLTTFLSGWLLRLTRG
jgi:uncharacterized protein with GYD domain